ncbi:hypothetical protein MAFF211271_31940 [Ralstonia syzygii subsp. indonesiensis]|nr:hypothetical protein MAFF211271_31940 [Ralstonia pseudosolanacearum]
MALGEYKVREGGQEQQDADDFALHFGGDSVCGMKISLRHVFRAEVYIRLGVFGRIWLRYRMS